MSDKQAKDERTSKAGRGASKSDVDAKSDPRAGAKNPAKQTSAKESSAKEAAAKASRVSGAQRDEGAPPDDEEEVEEHQGGFFNHEFFIKSTSFSSSLVLHAIVILVLGLITTVVTVKEEERVIEAVVEETPPDEVTAELDEQIDPATEVNLAASSSSQVASGTEGVAMSMEQPVLASEVVEQTTQDAISVETVSIDRLGARGQTTQMHVQEGTLGEPAEVVENMNQAMDRITQEILFKLTRGKVLVIWMFDESESMKDEQAEIKARIDRVYKELGLTSVASGDALLTAVASYGGGCTIHTQKPTSDLDKIRAAMDQVPIDASGLENMCSAVTQTVKHHIQYATKGQRQMMTIIVTDESGEMEDNEREVETAVATARAARCGIYCLGRESVFGYPYCYMRWTDPTTKLVFWLRINRGPETPMPEQLQTDGFTHRWDAHPSGFGPYEEARMCQQTGGVFFMLPSLESNLVRGEKRKYELEMMRPYLPDLSARVDYLSERSKHIDREVVWKVISDLNPYDKEHGKDVVVQIDGFSIDPVAFKRQVDTNLRDAERLVRYLRKAQAAMKKIKNIRDREESPRWRANYDLIYAQTVAYEVRVYEYGAYLTEFLKNPKPITNPATKRNPTWKTDHWEIHRVQRLITGDKYKDQIELAKKLLNDVIKDHPGTPYSARAEYELKLGFGVELIEDFTDPRRGGVKLPNL